MASATRASKPSTNRTGASVGARDRIRQRRAELDAERIRQEETENDLAAAIIEDQDRLDAEREAVAARERAIGMSINTLAETMSLAKIAELLDLDGATVRMYRKLYVDRATGGTPSSASPVDSGDDSAPSGASAVDDSYEVIDGAA